jgi:hypothetical protein
MLTLLAGAALILALVVPSAMAKGPGGGGGGGGGGGHETTVGNNLSVPTIMVGGGMFAGVTCGVPLVETTGDPLSGYSIDPLAYYYVQGVHKWQAQCLSTSDVVPVYAEWGDNLSGDAKLQVGKPIRVELGLFDTTGVQMDGYTVVKLQSELLDRNSAYGTLAVPDGSGGFVGTPTTFNRVRVFDGKVTFSVKNVATGAYVVQPGSNPTAEINATGSVVYGYNLRVSAVGLYEITFTTPSVTITGVDAGSYTATTATIVINVVAGGGGGGGGRR